MVGAKMGSYLRAAAITAAITVPAAVLYNARVAGDSDPWNELPAAVINLGTGSLGALGLAGAGVAALHPRTRGLSAAMAGIGSGLVLAGGAGIATMRFAPDGSD
jgi:hypothetical protein